jgi:diaminopimelate epimerase
MQLHNADGGEAEMSGNGIRCLAQAAVDAGLVTPPTFLVATAGGVRTVTFVPGEDPGWARASVDMGPVTLDPGTEIIDSRMARRANVGNPHLVLLGAGVAQVDIGVRGPELQLMYPDGINVEWIEPAHDAAGDFLELRVWERGAGETLACGTGSVAAAAAARDWGAVTGSGPVRVHNPGGMLEVTLGAGSGDPAVLAGPVRKVADIEIDPGMLS